MPWKVLFVIATLLAISPTSELHAQRLHALLVADTDSNIGESVRADIQNIKTILKDGLPQGKLSVIELTGSDVTPNQITSRLVNLQIQPNDAVILYYSGHGGYDRQNGHYLALSNGGRLYRSRVVNAITQPFTPRFWGVITDCCASIPPIAMAPVLAPGNSKTLLTHLFLESRGRIDITSSRPEQVSLGFAPPTGGVFTWSFCSVLHENAARRVNWDEIFRMTRAETARLAEMSMSRDPTPHVHDGIEQRTQIPYSFQTMYGQDVNGLRLGLSHTGLRITQVDNGSVAERAGMRSGMQIVRVNGKLIQSDDQMNTAINFSPRDTTIDVTHQGRSQTISVSLAY